MLQSSEFIEPVEVAGLAPWPGGRRKPCAFDNGACPVVRTGQTLVVSSQALAGYRILLAEDGAIIALQLARSLELAGAAVLGPVATVDDGLAALKANPIDCAVLDFALGHQDSLPIAEEAQRRHIPFVFLTGHDAAGVLPEAFASACWLEKPFIPAQLIQRILELLEPMETL